MASSEPLMDPLDLDDREKRIVMARLDAIDNTCAELLAGLERTIAMLDGFANRAEPLLTMAEKRAKRGALFTGGNRGS